MKFDYRVSESLEDYEKFGVYPEQYDEVKQIHIYNESFIIYEHQDGVFWTEVNRDECSGTKEEVEAFLAIKTENFTEV